MTTAGDTFATFVHAVASSLDDHEARGEALAASAHLSRYHFDRVVTAMAGETPARFRRRVLLERAAWRLRTSADTVLDVALEAGYSSNEAFTRAFRRVYRSGPSAWRRSPGQIFIDCPNGVHFYPPGGLSLPARSKETSMDLVLKLVEHHIWLVGQMLERASRLTGEQLDGPIELSVEAVDDNPTTRSLLSRLVGQMAMWNASMAGRDYDFDVEKDESIASMRSRLESAGAAFLGLAREVAAEDRWGDTFVDAVCDPPHVFTYGGMVAHVLTYAAHRRTLVAGAFYSAGVRDLDDDPMTWVADAV
ncbi:MAG: helix-turn-helix domain-containing protein [Dehalococcoidia bacterium]